MYDFELIYLKTRSARGKGRKMFPISPDPKPYLVLSISMWRENSFTGGTLWRADSLIKMMQRASNIAYVSPNIAHHIEPIHQEHEVVTRSPS